MEAMAVAMVEANDQAYFIVFEQFSFFANEAQKLDDGKCLVILKRCEFFQFREKNKLAKSIERRCAHCECVCVGIMFVCVSL